MSIKALVCRRLGVVMAVSFGGETLHHRLSSPDEVGLEAFILLAHLSASCFQAVGGWRVGSVPTPVALALSSEPRLAPLSSSLSFTLSFLLICRQQSDRHGSAQSAAGRRPPFPGLHRSVTSDWPNGSTGVLLCTPRCPALKWLT